MSQPRRRAHARVLMYSHDTLGLGHLRRCRAIAHALVEADPEVSVLNLSASRIIGSFDFSTRVVFVPTPAVIKLRNADTTSSSLLMSIADTPQFRPAITSHPPD